MALTEFSTIEIGPRASSAQQAAQQRNLKAELSMVKGLRIRISANALEIPGAQSVPGGALGINLLREKVGAGA